MYWLIEDLEQLKVFYNSGYKKAFIEVIPHSDIIHPVENNVSLVYIRPINARKGFMICCDHSEALGISKTHIDKVLDKFEVLYTRDKKEILHYFLVKSFWDITTPPNPYIRPTTKTHQIFYNKHKDNREINKIIPIVKHYEICEKMFWDLKPNIKKSQNLIEIKKYETFFNTKPSLVFNAIERNGIKVDKSKFEEYFHPIDSEYTYTQFNLKTTTTRPSNKFKNVNYAALNKENGCRTSFIPRNSKLIEIDISAYHPSLAARLIDYSFTTSDIHSHFATLYNVDYKKAKELTFKQLYGGVFKEYKGLEFFQKIEKFVLETWDKFEKEGFIECDISGFIYEKEKLDNMNPQKLFNYILQNMETSQNILILWDILLILKRKKTKLVLYTYDSFLFDWNEKETQVLEQIRQVFKKYELGIKEKQGYDYDFRTHSQYV